MNDAIADAWPARYFGHAMEVGYGGVAGLVLRRARSASVYDCGHAVCCAAADAWIRHSDAVRDKSSWIQAAFLIGWALGGGIFGRSGDRLGRSRALMLTILTYALFTGLSYFATRLVAAC